VSAVLSRPAEEYLSWLAVERGRAPNTIAAYRRDLLAYEEWLHSRGTDVTGATDGLVEGYVADLRAAGRRASSIARALSAVRSLHRFLVDEGTAETDPTGDVTAPRIPQGLPKALSEAEVTTLLDAVTGYDAGARRDRALLELLYGTGLRISEAVGLSLGDIDLEGHVLSALGKGSKERVVPVGRLAREALEAWLSPSGRGGDGPCPLGPPG
jgi:integrase/recombinase XerD